MLLFIDIFCCDCRVCGWTGQGLVFKNCSTTYHKPVWFFTLYYTSMRNIFFFRCWICVVSQIKDVYKNVLHTYADYFHLINELAKHLFSLQTEVGQLGLNGDVVPSHVVLVWEHNKDIVTIQSRQRLDSLVLEIINRQNFATIRLVWVSIEI